MRGGGPRRGRARLALIATCISLVAAVYAASTELGADLLLAGLRSPPSPSQKNATGRERAIVLLTGDHVWRAPAAAALQLRTNLPLVVAGRNAGHYFKVLQAVGVRTLWPESLSVNTEQNAAYSACLLARKDIGSVFIVTDEAHMPRALAWFGYYGLRATPVISGPPWPGHSPNPWLPSRIGWSRSKAVIHEWAGLIDFRWRALVQHRLPCPEAANPGEA